MRLLGAEVFAIETGNDETDGERVDPTAPETVQLAADLVVLGPGSWFTSVIPNVLVPEIAARAHVDLLDGIIASAMKTCLEDPAQDDGPAAPPYHRAAPRARRVDDATNAVR